MILLFSGTILTYIYCVTLLQHSLAEGVGFVAVPNILQGLLIYIAEDILAFLVKTARAHIPVYINDTARPQAIANQWRMEK